MDFQVGIILASIVALIGCRYFYRRQRAAIARQHGCEMPKALTTKDPIFGLDYHLGIHRDCSTAVAYHTRHGPTFEVKPLVGTRNIVTIAPDNIHAIYGSSKNWGVQPLRLSAMEGFVGHGLLTCDGEIWSRSRRMLKPIFNRSNISDLSTLVTATDMLLSELPTDGSTVDLQPKLYEMFFNTSMGFVLGRDILKGDCKSPHTPKTFIRAFHDALFGVGYRIVLGAASDYLMNKGFRSACRKCHEFIDFYTEKGFADMKETKNLHTPVPTTIEFEKEHKSILKGLTEQTDDTVFIRSQILQGMIGAQETTSILLSNTIFLLSRRPEYWKRIRAELQHAGENLADFDALGNCTAIHNILLESLRIYPPFPTMIRVALTDTVLPSGGGPDGKAPIFVRKGEHALSSFYAVHRTRPVFGDDLDAFNPDRWKDFYPAQWDYMAFGCGLRSCLGQQKALAEASYVLARLATKFSVLESRDEREWAPEIKLTCQNSNGCKVGLLQGPQ